MRALLQRTEHSRKKKKGVVHIRMDLKAHCAGRLTNALNSDNVSGLEHTRYEQNHDVANNQRSLFTNKVQGGGWYGVGSEF